MTAGRHQTDIVVVGSGGAALVAALAGSHRGAQVTLLERSRHVGGTTALSGGLVWVANNRHMRDAGVPDSVDEATTYVARLAAGRRRPDDIRSVIEAGPDMVDFLETASELRFEALDKPDYHPEFAGAKSRGRSLAPPPLEASALGAWMDRLRPGSGFSIPLSWAELDAMNGVFHPERLDFSLIQERTEAGYVGMGRALVGWLLKACLDRGVVIRTGTRARELLVSDGGVAGVRAHAEGGDLEVRARQATVLAAGGFEWNEQLCAQFVAGPVSHPASCPTNEGDAVKMGMAIGADLANMWDLWRFPTAAVPGETYEGRPLARMVVGERALPGAILVNAAGQRFVNEAHPYTDVGRTFMTWNPVQSAYQNWPAWAVFDGRFRRTYSVLSVMPDDGDPDWLVRADDLATLARRLGLPDANLSAAVDRFNRMVAAGHDTDFQRGESFFDQYYADFGRQPSPTLGPISEPPFYGLQVHPGAIGSSGGLLTDTWGRVLHVRGHPIPNLYAAGDSAASCFGPGYPGPGGPLGLGLTLGYRAGQHAVGAIR
jgi:succinate dehydrogenase/fumarate reductase flavoprotein subunit